MAKKNIDLISNGLSFYYNHSIPGVSLFSKYRHPFKKIFVYVFGAQSSKGVPVEVVTANSNRRYDLRLFS